MAKYKIEVDSETCIGCGACTASSPDLFEMKDDGKAYPKVTESDDDSAKDAVDICPVNSIKITEEGADSEVKNSEENTE